MDRGTDGSTRRREVNAHGKPHLKGFYVKIEAKRAVGETGVDPVREAEAHELMAALKLLELEREAAAAEEEKQAAAAAEEAQQAAAAAAAAEEAQQAAAAAAAAEEAQQAAAAAVVAPAPEAN